MFKEKLAPTLYNPIQKREEEETLPNSFYDNSIVVTLKPNKNNAKKKTADKVSYEHRAKTLPKRYQIESTW